MATVLCLGPTTKLFQVWDALIGYSTCSVGCHKTLVMSGSKGQILQLWNTTSSQSSLPQSPLVWPNFWLPRGFTASETEGWIPVSCQLRRMAWSGNRVAMGIEDERGTVVALDLTINTCDVWYILPFFYELAKVNRYPKHPNVTAFSITIILCPQVSTF